MQTPGPLPSSSSGGGSSRSGSNSNNGNFRGKTSIKAFPGGEMSPWKIAMRERLEKKVHEGRARIAATARGNQTSVADLLMDMVAEEDAARKDSKVMRGGGPTSPVDLELAAAAAAAAAGTPASQGKEAGEYRLGRRRLDEDEANGGRDDDDEDEGLTADERAQILLYLEETFYRAAKEEAEENEDERLYEEAEHWHRSAQEEAAMLAAAIAEFEGVGGGENPHPFSEPFSEGSSTMGTPLQQQQDQQGQYRHHHHYRPPSTYEDEEERAFWEGVMATEGEGDGDGGGAAQAGLTQGAGPAAASRGPRPLMPPSSASSSARCPPSFSCFPVSAILPGGSGGSASSAPLCPLCCGPRPLEEYSRVIFCRNQPCCGFRMDSHHTGLSSLQTLRDAIISSAAAHSASAASTVSSSSCPREPVVRLEERFGLRALYVCCDACGFMATVM